MDIVDGRGCFRGVLTVGVDRVFIYADPSRDALEGYYWRNEPDEQNSIIGLA